MADYISAVIAAVGLIFLVIGLEEKLKYRSAAYTKRYELIYAPMTALFQRNQIESAYVVLYPYFSQRWIKAIKYLVKGQVKSAVHALFNKGVTKETAAMVLGGCFPLDQIVDILQANMAFSDRKLRELVQAAQYSRQDNLYQEEDLLTDEEFKLFKHIANGYEKLNRELVP